VGQRLLNLQITEFVVLDRQSVAPLDIPAGFAFRFLNADEIARHAADPVLCLSPELARRAARGQDLCFAALAGDRLAAFGWYALGSIEAEHCGGTAMTYPADAAYMYHGFTHPDFRGCRLHGACMSLALEALGTRGIRRLVSSVHWSNWASLKSCYRLGYARLGRLVKLGFRPLQLAFYPRAARRLGICFGSHQRP
jgi:GNAT superfamily N-acetyltransferase